MLCVHVAIERAEGKSIQKKHLGNLRKGTYETVTWFYGMISRLSHAYKGLTAYTPTIMKVGHACTPAIIKAVGGARCCESAQSIHHMHTHTYTHAHTETIMRVTSSILPMWVSCIHATSLAHRIESIPSSR